MLFISQFILSLLQMFSKIVLHFWDFHITVFERCQVNIKTRPNYNNFIICVHTWWIITHTFSIDWTETINVRYPDKKYTLVKENKNWAEAKTHCETHYSGLCVIHTERDWKESKAALGDVTDPAWIGLHKNPDDTWQWSNEDNYFYLNWHGDIDQCKKDDCVIQYHSEWRVKDCDENTDYVCQKGMAFLILTPM